MDIDEVAEAEDLVLRVNDGRRKVPTFALAGRYFACSPFDPQQLSRELELQPNP